jgi:hypothetical protein
MGKEILITNGSNPQPEVRKNAETAIDWEYREEAATLYNMAVIIRDRLIDPVLRLDRSKVPDPVISFDNLRQSRTLATYTLARNPQGLLHEITFNTTHYEMVEGKPEWRFGRWAQLETLTHEYLHLKQQKYGRDPYRGRGGGHNKEFVTMAKQIGLNVVPVIGCHYSVADEDSPFALLMHELGIQRPADVPRADGEKPKDDWFEIGKKRKGRSSLTKWSCGCQNAWIGAAEFRAVCMDCGNEFTKATAVREILKQLANTLPPEPETEEEEFDIDAEIDRQQEKDWLYHERTDVDDWEDLGLWIESNG